MSHQLDGTTITLTRGDTFFIKVDIEDVNGDLYTPDPNDKIRFAMKKDYSESEPLILKEIPTDTMILKILPEDTKPLKYGTYVYDIEIAMADGVTVDTFITKAKFKITEEVY